MELGACHERASGSNLAFHVDFCSQIHRVRIFCGGQPGLLAFIVTSKFADYLPLYRLEDIFERQGFEISRATQSVWCGDVAEVVEPLYQRMADIAREAVALMDALFALERQAQDVSVAERLPVRQEKSVPLLAELHRKLLIWKEQLLPKHPMADAVNYTLSQWGALTVFTTDGAVPIDNNVSEREMKRIVLNRKNSLFVGNPRGGRTAAILASLTSSCRRHDMDPHLYFMQLLVNLPSWPARDLDAWLPDRWKQAHIARCAALGIPAPPNP
jgi:Transposase IS66 family